MEKEKKESKSYIVWGIIAILVLMAIVLGFGLLYYNFKYNNINFDS